jgi:hypothetical protein
VSLRDLTPEEQEVVRKCVLAVAEGPFISEGEFHTLMGLWRGEVTIIASRWPDLDEAEEDVQLAINNGMNSLLNCDGWQVADPETGAEPLQKWIGTTPEEVERIFLKWRGSPSPERS